MSLQYDVNNTFQGFPMGPGDLFNLNEEIKKHGSLVVQGLFQKQTGLGINSILYGLNRQTIFSGGNTLNTISDGIVSIENRLMVVQGNTNVNQFNDLAINVTSTNVEDVLWGDGLTRPSIKRYSAVVGEYQNPSVSYRLNQLEHLSPRVECTPNATFINSSAHVPAAVQKVAASSFKLEGLAELSSVPSTGAWLLDFEDVDSSLKPMLFNVTHTDNAGDSTMIILKLEQKSGGGGRLSYVSGNIPNTPTTLNLSNIIW